MEEVVLPVEKKPRIDHGDDKEMNDSNSEGTKSQSSLLSKSQSQSSKSHLKDSSSQSQSQSQSPNRDGSEYDLSSDDEYYYCNKNSSEDLQRHTKEVKDSEGYDVTGLVYPVPNCIHPIRNNVETFPLYTEIINRAIDQYNRENNTTLKLVQILNLTTRWGMTGEYYYTFHAKDGDDARPKTYQAYVYICGKDVEVIQFRLKPAAT